MHRVRSRLAVACRRGVPGSRPGPERTRPTSPSARLLRLLGRLRSPGTWAVGDRKDSEVYAEIRQGVVNAGSTPKTKALSDVLELLAKQPRDLTTSPEPDGPGPVPKWLTDALLFVVHLPASRVEEMSLEEAEKAWETPPQGRGPATNLWASPEDVFMAAYARYAACQGVSSDPPRSSVAAGLHRLMAPLRPRTWPPQDAVAVTGQALGFCSQRFEEVMPDDVCDHGIERYICLHRTAQPYQSVSFAGPVDDTYGESSPSVQESRISSSRLVAAAHSSTCESA